MPLIELKDATSRLFDYLIVGGGAAGLALAARLTENLQVSVLVLEAGQENPNDPLVLELGLPGQLAGNGRYAWGLQTAPQPHCNNKEILWTRGKMVGGSTAINVASYNIPSKTDIDTWELLGNNGWNWERFHKYIHRAITYTPSALSESEHLRRGTPDQLRSLWKNQVGNGPVQVSHPPVVIDVEIKAFETFQNLGIPLAPAPMNGDPIGINICPMTRDPKTQHRSYAANAYWTPNSTRPNFHLLTGALAHRLISSDVDGELVVTGVEFSHTSNAGKTYIARASREVILSTGTLKTPQVLELSGIGCPEVLKKIGVPIKLALDGVGENIQDHINGFITFELKEGIPDETFDVARNPADVVRHKELLSKNEGFYAMGVGNHIFTPLKTVSDKAEEIISEAKKTIAEGIAAGIYSASTVDQYKILLNNLDKKVPTCTIATFPALLHGPKLPEPGKKYISMLAGLNHPFSRGTIHATSSNSKIDAEMDPHYFEKEIDLKILTEIVKFCKKIGRTAPLSDYFADEFFPGPQVTTDEEIATYLKTWVGSTFHTTGSASMLPRDKGGVVDTELKVYGTKNLRVVDLSIVPILFGSHSQSVAYGIGEIAADIIKSSSVA